MAFDRFGEAIGEYTVQFKGDEVKIKLKIGQLHNFYKLVTGFNEEQKTERFEVLSKLVEQVTIQGNPEQKAEEIKFWVEQNFSKYSEAVTKALGLTDSEKAVKEKDKLKN